LLVTSSLERSRGEKPSLEMSQFTSKYGVCGFIKKLCKNYYILNVP